MSEPIPLFPIEPAPTGGGEIETAATEMFAALEKKTTLDPVTAAKKPVIMTMARALDAINARGRNKGLSVADAKTFKQYAEILESLPVVSVTTDADLDALEQTIAALTAEALA